MKRLFSLLAMLMLMLPTFADDTFWLGADISGTSTLESFGQQLFNAQGESCENTRLMKSYGLNAARYRVWVNPRGGFSSKEDVLKLALRAKELDMAIMIDFHYSDWWADPGKQNIPKAWEEMNYEQMKSALAQHTRETLQLLKENGIDVKWVQVGNETTNGFLWPMGRSSENMEQYAGLTQAGYNAVKEVYPDALCIVHLDGGCDPKRYLHIFEGLKRYGAKWDMIGMSIYPYWDIDAKLTQSEDETLEKAIANINQLWDAYHTPLMIVETGYDADHPDEGKLFLNRLINAARHQTGGHCKGIFYWAPEAEGHYKLGAFRNHRPTAIMDAFKEASSALCQTEEIKVKSPSGNLEVVVRNESGKVTYQVSLDGKQMVAKSNLGLNTSIGDLTNGLKIVGNKTEAVEKHYDMRTIKTSHIDYKANKLVLTVENEKKKQMTITFMVSDNDVAFKYGIAKGPRDKQRTLIFGEATSFNFPDGTTTFITPQIGPETGWANTKPSYEEGYSVDGQMNVKSHYGRGYTFPLMFHLPDGWALVSETGTTGAYCGTHVSDYQPGVGYTIAFPDKGENGGFGSEFVAMSLPGETPWRTITVGSTLKPIVETTVSYDVVDPLYEPAYDYKPGRYTWSWLIWQDGATNYKDQVHLIDLASTMGYEYCLVDALWDTQIGRDKMVELSRYAQSKGVSLMLWYNSNGYWNDAPQGPRNCLNTSLARNREFKWLQEIGVKGIKVDFFGGDKQETLQLYEDIMVDANRYGIQCIFHGCTLPRGWERMFPNYVASEAVLASENVFFGEGAAIHEPFDLTLHPFCRNAVASIDWGGVIMNKYLSRDNKSRHSRKTTDIFEMASGITNQTSIQCVAMYPNNLQELPQFELDFLKGLPTTWDETRFIDGYPGKYVVLARRHGDDWYIAGLNAQKEPLKLTLDLSMFVGKTPTIYIDNQKGEPTMTTLKIDKKGKAKVVIQPNGGLIIR